MLLTISLALLTFLLVGAGMAVGVIMGRPPLKGSCGGLGNDGKCGLCGRTASEVEQCPDRGRAG